MCHVIMCIAIVVLRNCQITYVHKIWLINLLQDDIQASEILTIQGYTELTIQVQESMVGLARLVGKCL